MTALKAIFHIYEKRVKSGIMPDRSKFFFSNLGGLTTIWKYELEISAVYDKYSRFGDKFKNSPRSFSAPMC